MADALTDAVVFLRARTRGHTDDSEPNIPVHYIRTIQSKMDLKTGDYLMTLTTNILSPTAPFTITKPTFTDATGTHNSPTGSISVHRP